MSGEYEEIVSQIGIPALLEQSAEECLELGHILLKLSRKLRKENPTPVTVEDLKEGLTEEAGDVVNCLEALIDCGLISPMSMDMVRAKKIPRWKKRLQKMLNKGDN